ncbi:hypothetical protein PHMEG_00019718, partial [Phytophthora megakarya]
KTNTGRAKGARHSTDLATCDFQSLSEDELLIIEVCDQDVTSTLRIFGIKMKFSDKVQTLGFPDYEPHKHETKYLKDRWSMEAAWESRVLDFVLPCIQMFEDRSKEFYFHRVRDLSKGVMPGIREYLESLEEHTDGWWYILYWFTMSMEDDRAKELHLWRRKCRETLDRNFLLLVQRLELIDKFPKTLWYEPGLWILPNTICYWIFKDPSVNFRTVSGLLTCSPSSWNGTKENLREHSGQMLRVKLRVWNTYQRRSSPNVCSENRASGPATCCRFQDLPPLRSQGLRKSHTSPSRPGCYISGLQLGLNV